MGQHPLFADQIGLGGQGHQLRTTRQLRELRDYVTVPRTDPLIARQADTNDVDLGPRLTDQCVEPFSQQGAGTVQSWCVDQNHLP